MPVARAERCPSSEKSRRGGARENNRGQAGFLPRGSDRKPAEKFPRNNAPKLWKEIIQGTLPAGEKADLIIFESTADGGQGEFYNFTMENYNGEGDYEVLFFPWYEVPEYLKQLNSSKKWIQARESREGSACFDTG